MLQNAQRVKRHISSNGIAVELGYNVMKGTEYFVSLQTSVVITDENNFTVNSEELIGTAVYLTL
jgi:hypothetical protein